MNAVEVRGLRKSYDGFEAVRGIDFELRAGEVFGLLGPNGAGKTTTVEILVLDEPTTGFDPSARRAAWETIRALRALGKTILLTTHYIEEAHRLADRVAVLRRGEIVASGTPADLISQAPATIIRYRRNGEEVVLATEEPTRALHELTGQALRDGFDLVGLEVHRPTLEEVYLSLTEESPE